MQYSIEIRRNKSIILSFEPSLQSHDGMHLRKELTHLFRYGYAPEGWSVDDDENGLRLYRYISEEEHSTSNLLRLVREAQENIYLLADQMKMFLLMQYAATEADKEEQSNG